MEAPVTRDEYESIELYLYGLRLFTESNEYFQLSIKVRNKVNQEIVQMQMLFSVLATIFEPTKAPRRSVVAWKATKVVNNQHMNNIPHIPPTDSSYVYAFTSAQVAGKALDLEPGDICRITSGRRKTLKGYSFMYLEDYEALRKTIDNSKNYWWEVD
jgi:hypothetical protein